MSLSLFKIRGPGGRSHLDVCHVRGFVLRHAGDEATNASARAGGKVLPFFVGGRLRAGEVNRPNLTYFSDNGRSLIKFGDNFQTEPPPQNERQKERKGKVEFSAFSSSWNAVCRV